MNTYYFIGSLLILFGSVQFSNGHDMKNTSLISNERRLYEYLLLDYNRYVRPVHNENSTVDVQIGITIVNIESLDERTQTLNLRAWLNLQWTDEQLTWDPSEYGGIKEMRLPADQVWLPDITLYNSVEPKYEYDHFIVAVYSYGLVLLIPQINLASLCPLDMTHFPFDKHDCELKFGSWTYHARLVNITLSAYGPTVDMSYNTEHHEFKIASEKITAVRTDKKYACCKEIYPTVTFTLPLIRKSSYYNTMFVTPGIVLSLLAPILFWLPAHSSDKVTFGGLLLLSIVMMLAMLEAYIPSAHPTMPIIGVYYIAVFVLIALSVVFAMIVRNIWTRHLLKPQVPALVKKIFLDGIGRFLCVKGDPYAALECDQPRSRHMEAMTDADSFGDGQIPDKMDMVETFARQATMGEWRQLAIVLDRLFFVLFLVVVIILSVACLHY